MDIKIGKLTVRNMTRNVIVLDLPRAAYIIPQWDVYLKASEDCILPPRKKNTVYLVDEAVARNFPGRDDVVFISSECDRVSKSRQYHICSTLSQLSTGY